MPFTTGQLCGQQLFELTTNIVLARKADLVEPALLDVPGVAQARTQLYPHLVAQDQPDTSTGAGTATTGTLSVAAFATDLEKCLRHEGVCTYKVMSGVDRELAGHSGQRRPLWLLRVGLADGQPVRFEVADRAQPAIYAPRPLYNTLQERPEVPSYRYDPKKGIDFTKPVGSTAFAGVDVDVWLRQLIAAVDACFTPEFLIPALLVDACQSTYSDGPWLPALREAKESLATSLSRLAVAVFKDQDPVVDADVQEAYRQQALVTLASLFNAVAGLRFGANVTADPDTGEGYPLRLYGTTIPRADSDQATTVSAAKVDLRTGSRPLVMLVSSTGKDRDGAVKAYTKLDPTYRVTSIEHQIAELPGIEGYLASSWLAFVLPPTPAEKDAWPLDGRIGFVRRGGLVAGGVATLELPVPIRQGLPLSAGQRLLHGRVPPSNGAGRAHL